MARAGLVTLRDQLRVMCEAGTADYAVGSVTYWTEAALDTVLDRHRVDILRERLTPTEKLVGGGTIEYHDYYSAFGPFEETTGGTAVFIIQDTLGNTQGSSGYTIDYQRGLVSFTADTTGSVMLLTGRSYDMNGAAADMWRSKAAHYAMAFSFSTDNHSLQRGQLIDHCMKMAAFYEARIGMGGNAAQTVDVFRGDELP
jgi:hypothetical protein